MIPARIIPFLVVLLGLLLVAHLAVRLLARGADGTLLPLAALLHGIGYVMITRLDDDLAGLQTTWTFIAIAAFIATLLVVQRAPDLARYQWTFLFVGVGLLLLPLVPGIGRSVGGARIWVSIGPDQLPAGRVRQARARPVLRRLPGRQPRADRRRHVAGRPAPPPRAPPPPADRGRLGRSPSSSWSAEQDLGSSLLFFTLFVVMLWVATERPAYLVIGLVLFAAARVRRRGGMFGHVQTRVDDLARPVGRLRGQGLPDRPGAVRARRRRHRRHRPRPRQPEQDPRGARTTSSSPRSARSSACSARPRC